MPRPRAEVDMVKLRALMRFRPRLMDAAGFFEVSEDTIERIIRKNFKCTFAEYRDKQMAHTRMSLVQKCVGLALAGDKTMLIWCTKNLCNWSDKVESIEADDKEVYERPETMRRK